MKFLLVMILFSAPLCSIRAVSPDPLEAGFTQPPEQTKPWCYWYWISDNISKDGITRDLEAMARAGIGEALLGNVVDPDTPPGSVRLFSDEWWSLLEHAVREGKRTNVKIGLFNGPGWSQSGGPWITARDTMRHVVSSETRITGPVKFPGRLAAPKEPFQDIAVLAFPAPRGDAETISAHSPRVTCDPPLAAPELLVDGDVQTGCDFPAQAENAPFTVDISLDEPFTARSLALHPRDGEFLARCKLQAADDAGTFRTIREFTMDRRGPGPDHRVNVGPMINGPVVVTFAPATARRFRLLISDMQGNTGFAEINLSGAARLDHFVEKELGKMFATPFPQWDSYLWPASPEPESADLTVAPSAIRDLSDKLDADGTLHWDVPAGEWVIQRVGMTPTGAVNHPTTIEGRGLECDKMSRAAVGKHFDNFVGKLAARIPESDRSALRHVVIDSFEVGSQNWTDGFGKEFERSCGYDPNPWLPVLSGRIVGSADQSDRFLWDLRRLVADRIAGDYVGGLRDAAHRFGLRLWLENYGHWGFPAEFLQYGGEADEVAGEFWLGNNLGAIELRCASSCVSTYGKKPVVSAEAFTGGPPFQSSPGSLKARGDWAFCEGINHFVLHVYIHQPWEDKVPGVNAWFGTEFNRHNTWFERGSAWVDYLRRSCWLLQQGRRVADVAYFIGEDTPKMTGTRNPGLPAGRDFDYINSEVIEKHLSVKDGVLTLPWGTTYRVLVLPDLPTMRPELLRKIRDLVNAGATVVGRPPSRSPSMKNFPECDGEVRELAREIWGDADTKQPGEHRFGSGRVVWGKTLEQIFAADHFAPDIEFRHQEPNLLYTHRTSPEAEVYFLSNQKDRTEKADCVFRVAGRQPELWDATGGGWRDLPDWREEEGRTVIPLEFAAHQSWFVVFRRPATPPARTAPNFPELKTVATIGGPWEVDFAPGWGAPEKAAFDQLTDWTKRPEKGIRFFSGRATYRRTFELPECKPENQSIKRILDLGDVRDLATVRVNGKDLGTLWCPPWQVDITSALKPGANRLEVEVVNVWNNRLVGDAELPVAERRTFLTAPNVRKQPLLLPAGLLGPVTVRADNSDMDRRESDRPFREGGPTPGER